METIKRILDLTNNTINAWEKNYHGYAPYSAAVELDKVPFERIRSFTEKIIDDLKLRIDNIDYVASDADIVTSYVLLDALVEGWMFVFLKIYIDDYKKKDFNSLNFYKVIRYFKQNIWKGKKGCKSMAKWANKLRRYRNSVHIYNKKGIGDEQELDSDIERYYKFLDKFIVESLPDPQ